MSIEGHACKGMSYSHRLFGIFLRCRPQGSTLRDGGEDGSVLHTVCLAVSPGRRRASSPDAGGMLRPPVAPMLAKPVEVVPTGHGLSYEPKWDGWRALAFRHQDGVYPQSRSGRELGPYFPDVLEALNQAVAPGTVLDGELVVWAGERTDFSLLQRRATAGTGRDALARSHPAHYVVFDLLSAPPGLPLLDKPLAERRALLTSLLADAPAQLTLSPQSTDVRQATEWLHTWTAAGIEGLLIKRLDSRYEPGKHGWRKYRAYHTTEAIIGGVTPSLSNPETLLLGRLDEHGRLRYAGRTHSLRSAQRAELIDLLTPHTAAPDAHPWPQPLPASWTGQLDRPQPLPYTPILPAVAAEIEVDTAYEHHRWRHLVRYRRPRLDLAITDVPPLGSQF
ncbi:ATP-dependent DNA ligase [Micromonospora coxensis]|uniref:ATP-dependent DNA ligase n=1 Tax=Micromonospora coxensis TaxID=356852 RepID=UPI00342C3E3E